MTPDGYQPGLTRPEPKTPEAARREVERARERVDADLDAIGGRIHDTRRQVMERRQKVSDFAKAPGRAVRRNPMASMLIAAAGGMLLGFGRARRHRTA